MLKHSGIIVNIDTHGEVMVKCQISFWCHLVLIFAGKENSGFVESGDDIAPNNRRVKKKQQNIIER